MAPGPASRRSPMCGATSRAQRKAHFTLTSKILSQARSSVCAADIRRPAARRRPVRGGGRRTSRSGPKAGLAAALETRMSMPPCAATVSRIKRSRSGWLATWHAMPDALSPRPRSCATAPSTFSCASRRRQARPHRRCWRPRRPRDGNGRAADMHRNKRPTRHETVTMGDTRYQSRWRLAANGAIAPATSGGARRSKSSTAAPSVRLSVRPLIVSITTTVLIQRQ